jgi:predicted RNase H-like nuclease
VLGVDACRAGWAGILLREDGGVVALFDPSIARLVGSAARVGQLAAIGIDIPIGLPDRGRREADERTRDRLGPRRSSLFMTPVRAAVQADTYALANQVNRRLAGEGLSRQAYALRRRILEVDAWHPAAPAPVVEVHPELSFCLLAGTPMAASKKTWAGADARRAALSVAGIDLPGDLGRLGQVAAVDDVLDAAAAAWTARRVVAGTAVSLPDPPQILPGGASAAIWA